MLFQLIIIQVVTFLAIVLVLRKLLYTETAREAKRLRVLKEETTQRQRELNEKIEAAEKAYREKLAQAEEEVRRLRAKSEEEMAEQRRKIIKRAKEEAEQILEAALNAKEKIREEARLQMEEKIPAKVVLVFKEVLSDEAKEITHKELVNKVIAEVERLDKSKFKVDAKKGELILAYPLERSEKNRLVSSVSDKLGHKIELDEKEDKKLIAGVVLKLGRFVIDGSLENNLKHIKS
ncbi:MAG: F0F1 ATP synthase subunit delta [Candidatus Omnitrophica bacterium]|nr:F0F1 ATP synthase subunit delta [Candidatus Omnitrophota bacterium]